MKGKSLITMKQINLIFKNFFVKFFFGKILLAPSIFFEDFEFFYKKNINICFEGKTIFTSMGRYQDFNFLY